MAHSFITTENAGGKVARQALSLLAAELVLGRLVHRSAESEFAGGVGNVVNVKKPGQTQDAHDAGTATPTVGTGTQGYLDIRESSVQIRLDHHFIHPVKVTSRELSLDLESFAAQVLAPQVRKIGERVEAAIAAPMNAAIKAVPEAGTVDPAKAKALREAIIAAGVTMDEANVPDTGRVLVVSPAFYGELLKDDIFVKVNESGSTEAIRNARVGNILNFEVFKSNYLKGGALAMTREAFALAVRAPQASMGAKFSGSESYQGYAMRWIQDWDTAGLSDLSICDVFVGAKALFQGTDPITNAPEFPRYVPITLKGNGTKA
ncbi:P22 phage major capsid protein family protein [Streptomyces olivoreticuli]|uniref:P22 phage major capsid protein family protein n=1 Tax=Streptomyces olivoreticuli TaxID=68246 RepID=UPI0013C2F630|nr:P22 phage major capsid protein family protein [Streptomyces olivoreticuli]